MTIEHALSKDCPCLPRVEDYRATSNVPQLHAARALRLVARRLIEGRAPSMFLGPDAEGLANWAISRVARPEELKGQRREVQALAFCLAASLCEPPSEGKENGE